MRDVVEDILASEAGLGMLQARDEAGVLWLRYRGRDVVMMSAFVLAILIVGVQAAWVIAVLVLPAGLRVLLLLATLGFILSAFLLVRWFGRYLSRWRVRYHLRRPACFACGYPLHGLDDWHLSDGEGDDAADQPGEYGIRLRCPECGHASPVAVRLWMRSRALNCVVE